LLQVYAKLALLESNMSQYGATAVAVSVCLDY